MPLFKKRKVCKGPGRINGHEFVAMGDGLKWATCNIGASGPEDKGDFFIWGETEPRKNSLETSKYGHDRKTFLDLTDDAASVNWGGSWRMPVAREFEKLLDEDLFSWEETTVNGVEGYTVYSKVKGYEGNSIFLPRAAYWSSELVPPRQADDVACEAAHILNLNKGKKEVTFHSRCWGFPIRPVSI